MLGDFIAKFSQYYRRSCIRDKIAKSRRIRHFPAIFLALIQPTNNHNFSAFWQIRTLCLGGTASTQTKLIESKLIINI
jgi:hypothetical protein